MNITTACRTLYSTQAAVRIALIRSCAAAYRPSHTHIHAHTHSAVRAVPAAARSITSLPGGHRATVRKPSRPAITMSRQGTLAGFFTRAAAPAPSRTGTQEVQPAQPAAADAKDVAVPAAATPSSTAAAGLPSAAADGSSPDENVRAAETVAKSSSSPVRSTRAAARIVDSSDSEGDAAGDVPLRALKGAKAGEKRASGAASATPAGSASPRKSSKTQAKADNGSGSSSEGESPAAPAVAKVTKKAKVTKPAAGAAASIAIGAAGVTDGVDAAITAAAGYHPLNDAEWTKSPTLREKGVPFSALVGVFSSIEATTKRVAITAMLTNFFRSIIAACPQDLLPVVYLCTNSIAPAYENLELGVGDSILMKALAESTGRQLKDVKADADDKGDLGLVAETSRSKQKTIFGFGAAGGPGATTLTCRSVFTTFKSIAQESGRASQDKKIALIKRMLVGASGVEAKYIIRAMQGSLRIGLAKQTVLVSLAHSVTFTQPLALDPLEEDADIPASSEAALRCRAAAERAGYAVLERTGDDLPIVLDTTSTASGKRVPRDAVARRLESAVNTLKQVFSEMPSYDALVPNLLRGGVRIARERCTLTPGIPVAPMLAKPTKGVREVLDRFENVTGGFTCEWKYDGERAQIHVLDGGANISIYSRNSENTTGKYPDLASTLQLAIREPADAAASEPTDGAEAGAASSPLRVTSCVLDGEVVAYDRDRNALMPFQVLSTRARKDVAEDNIKVQIIYVAFDLLYLNGESLLHTPLVRRRELLRSAFTEIPGRFAFATHAESADVEEISAFLNEAVKGGCEGLMVKVLDGPDSVYEPSKRSLNWLKLKKDYMDGLTDSLDLVPIGAWRGKGKRTGVFGAYLLACYDPEDESYQSVTRIGTGFSEDMLAELTRVFNEKGCVRPNKPSNVMVSEGMSDVDVWFDPDESEVWEVMAADLSISPVHMAAIGLVDSSKGVALRFPRFLRRRDDKSPVDATSASQVADMYRAQSTVARGTAVADEDDWE